MKKVFLAALLLVAAAALFAMPASAVQNEMTMDVSQSYLRLGFDDSVTVSVHLTSGAANVPIVMKCRTGGDYVEFEKSLVITDKNGDGSAVIRLNPEKQPASPKLPLQVMVEATVIGDEGTSAFYMIYITNTGPIWGYVLDDFGSTITGAQITVMTPDGKIFPGSPYMSNEETPMGFYRIDNLPILPTGPDTLTATKNGYTGVRKNGEPGIDSIRYDIVISGYQDKIDVPSIVGNANITLTPTPVPDESETPAKPTTMTTTILITIVLITLVYIGLKAYRRMF